MKSLLIIGAGGYGQLVRELADRSGYDTIDFLDDHLPGSAGTINDLEILQDRYDGCIIAIGDAEVRERIGERIRNLVTIVHPSAVVSRSAQIDNGCVIEANTTINAHATIGKASFVCAGAVINHDAFVGKYCQIDCNAVVASGAAVPDKTKVQSLSVWSERPENR